MLLNLFAPTVRDPMFLYFLMLEGVREILC
ncbi:hypothetical protein MTBLM5_20090 [Magnetospirillum sp. LM-5]|nr:hypothetical protein MTBLM5_20090 [Magnetospirillum sp. LM-5]